MDYLELLFAAQVRQMALAVIDTNMPPGLSDEQRKQHAIKEFPRVAANITRDLKNVAEMIRETQ